MKDIYMRCFAPRCDPSYVAFINVKNNVKVDDYILCFAQRRDPSYVVLINVKNNVKVYAII
jgi:hypothetical protein